MANKLGNLIYRSAEDGALLEIREDGAQRYLYFENNAIQSAMSLQQPHTLALSYTRAMTAGLLFNNEPRNTLMIGLGGGSLVRFWQRYLPDCELDVVDNRRDVIRIAEKYFDIRPGTQLHLLCEDGETFLHRALQTHARQYDMILVDAFDGAGIAAAMQSDSFFRAARGMLAENGVFAMNLWSNDAAIFRHCFARIEQYFAEPALKLPVEGKGNVIALCGTDTLMLDNLELPQRATELKTNTGIEFPTLLRALLRHNRHHGTHWWQRLWPKY